MASSPAPAAAGASSVPAAAFPRSERRAHIGRRVGVVLEDGSRFVGILHAWGQYELTLIDVTRFRHFPVGRVAYVVNLHTHSAHSTFTR